MAHIYTGKNISFQHKGKFLQAGQSHASFALIVSAALEGDYEKAAELLDLKAVVQGAIKGSDMELVGNSVVFKGRVVPGVLGQRVLELVKAGHTATPLQNFLSNLWENPSYRASRELYDFLEAANLPITEDGYFLAYKSVRPDFTDHHTGKMDNSVGTLVSMPRHGVDEDKDRTCSAGLHFAAYSYANDFGGRNGQMVVVKVNPRDVVAIPSDYNNEKGRACAYTILEALDTGDNKLTGEAFVDTGTSKEEESKEEPKDKNKELYASLIVGNTYEISGNLEVFRPELSYLESFKATYAGDVEWDTPLGKQWCTSPVSYGVVITPITVEEPEETNESILASLIEGRTYEISGNLGYFHARLQGAPFKAVYLGNGCWDTEIGPQLCSYPLRNAINFTLVEEPEEEPKVEPKKLEKGDRVTLSKSSRFAGLGLNNPLDTEGLITSIEGRILPIEVTWGEGSHNTYQEEDLVLVSKGEPEETKEEEYVPQSDNYDDEALWIEGTLFTGKASEFPINRKSTYNVKRSGSDRVRENYHFITYDEKHDNLVFRKHNGVDFDYFTVSDVDQWWITVADIVLGE